MNKHRRALRAGLAVVLAVTGAAALPAAHAAADGSAAATKFRDDFNGDGYADLAVAAPSGTVAGKKYAGFVAVVYGSPTGLKTSARQVFSQNSPGIPGTAETSDRFGGSLATGDLDGDGYADLVVGVGAENTDAGSVAGLVEVVWGGPKGLSGGAVVARGARHDMLGREGRLAVADVDGDGADDVVSVQNLKDLRIDNGPFARDGSTTHGGQVVKDPYDSIVLNLAAGDLNGDGFDDVAATDTGNGEPDTRRVQYWLGTRTGLTPFTLVYDVDGAGLQGGENLAIGDVDGDGYGDIVMGRAQDGWESDQYVPYAKGGVVAWIPGTPDGPDGVRAKWINQDTAGVPGTAESHDLFGTDVQVADVDGDGYADISVGAPFEDVGTVGNAGRIVVLRGTANGPTGSGAQSFTQNTAGVPGAAEADDNLGRATHLVDSNHDGRAELVVGAPAENGGSGWVGVFRSTASGVSASGSFAFGNGTLGTPGTGSLLGYNFSD